MDYKIISIPDMNDSISRITLNKTAYHIRFTYNDSGGFWKFSLYDDQQKPIVIGIKIIPNFPLNVFYGASRLPNGIFAAITKKKSVGRLDFIENNAKFAFIPVEM